jgi:hypothetical protein
VEDGRLCSLKVVFDPRPVLAVTAAYEAYVPDKDSSIVEVATYELKNSDPVHYFSQLFAVIDRGELAIKGPSSRDNRR